MEVHEPEVAPRRKRNEGFTLIELLIVIVILGVLSGVVVFAVGGITDRGQKSSCKADYKTLEVAIEAYRAEKTVLPASEADLAPYIRSQSKWYDVAAGGAITLDAVTNPNPCTAPPAA